MEDRYNFRGKRVDNGKWVEGYYVGPMGCIGEKYSVSRIYFASGPCVKVLPETVGQCTDLKDWNHELIFEGDIIKISDKQIADVRWNPEFGSWDMRQKGYPSYPLQQYIGHSEVIGNIYDNPELLGGDES